MAANPVMVVAESARVLSGTIRMGGGIAALKIPEADAAPIPDDGVRMMTGAMKGGLVNLSVIVLVLFLMIVAAGGGL